jgi:hypothetical protein
MNKLVRNNILVSILLLLGLTNYTLATPDLPISTQTLDEVKDEKIEILQEIKIEVQSSDLSKNPKLKDGNACSDEDLEEVQGKLFTEIPIAKTIPCDKVDCKGLSAAKMQKDDYVKLKTAKTISCHK